MPQPTADHPRALRRALSLDAVAVLALGATVAVTAIRGDRRGPDGGFFDDPVPSLLALLAVGAAVAGGAVAAWALAREPLATRAGRWGLGLAVALLVSFPVLWTITLIRDVTYGWAEPIIPLQAAAGLGAVVLGAVAREPGRRGLLLIPFVLGTVALAFTLGDLIVPYE